MNSLQIAYKILYSLEYREKPEYAGAVIGYEALGIDQEKWFDVLEMLLEEQYITGAKVGRDVVGGRYADVRRIRITLRGAEYLHENSAMQKTGKIAANVIGAVVK